MSSQFKLLHPYVSQRLLSLFETLAKKHARLEAKIRTMSTILGGANSANLELVSIGKNKSRVNFISMYNIVNFFVTDPRHDNLGGGSQNGARDS